MAKFRIKVIGILLANGLVAKAYEVVDENQLTRPSKDMIKDGFIVALKASELKSLEDDSEKTINPIIPPLNEEEEEGKK